MAHCAVSSLLSVVCADGDGSYIPAVETLNGCVKAALSEKGQFQSLDTSLPPSVRHWTTSAYAWLLSWQHGAMDSWWHAILDSRGMVAWCRGDMVAE